MLARLRPRAALRIFRQHVHFDVHAHARRERMQVSRRVGVGQDRDPDLVALDPRDRQADPFHRD